MSFESEHYPYRLTVPAALDPTTPGQAREAWDGQSRIDAGGPKTDFFYLPGGRLVFIYGAPTDLDLAAYAVAGQQLKSSWHGCPADPDIARDAQLGEAPARILDFPCGGLHLLSLYAVHAGFGIVVNMMSPPGHDEDDNALFDQLTAGWEWAD